MNELKNRIEKYLKKVNDYSKYDFYIDVHEYVYINCKKFNKYAQITDLAIEHKKIFNNKEYILLTHAKNIYLIKQTNVRKYKVCDFLEAFGFIQIIDHFDYKLILSQYDNINLSKQYIFTYTIFKFFEKYYSNYSFQVEYELLKKIGKIQISNNTGPRLDICIEELLLAIEFDEDQHDDFDNMDLDISREQIIKACGYTVIRCKQSMLIPDFIKNLLIPLINELELVMDEDKIEDRIIKDLIIHNCGSEDKIKLLISEQIMDIKEKKSNQNIQIGYQIRNLSLNKNIFDWLDITVDDSDRNFIIELFDDIEAPILRIDDDILLSPKAFEEIISYLNPSKYKDIILIRKYMTNIKDRLLEYTINSNIKIKELRTCQKDAIPDLVNYHYIRGKKDTSAKIKECENTNKKLEKNLLIINEFLDYKYPEFKTKNKNKVVKSNNFILEIGKPVLEEIPELIFTNNYDDFIFKDDIKPLLIILSRQNKNINSFKKSINILETRLDQSNTTILYENILLRCNWIWKIKIKEISNIVMQHNFNIDSDDNDEF